MFKVGDNVIAVAVVVNENVFACAAAQGVIALAADDSIIAVAAEDCIFACATVNVIVFFGTDNSVRLFIGDNAHIVSNCRGVNRLSHAREVVKYRNVKAVVSVLFIERNFAAYISPTVIGLFWPPNSFVISINNLDIFVLRIFNGDATVTSSEDIIIAVKDCG